MDISSYSLKSLNIFRVLYENNIATKTAEILGITQSGVSRSLAQLEETTGLQLFIRQKNRLVATPEADELYKEVARLMFNLDELQHSINALREFGASRVRIATIPGLAYGFVPKIISRIHHENSKLNIYFDVMSTNDVVRSVELGQFDIGFVTLPIESQQLQLDKLIKTEAVCLLPKGHPFAKLESVQVSDLSGQHLVIPNQPNIAADQLLKLIAEKKIQLAGKTEANISGICALVANGVGVSVVNPITAKDLMHKSIIVKPFSPAIHYSFGLLYRNKWRESKLIRMIHDGVQQL
ncbi:MAG: LysR family transcriptional regulator [Kangiellaceae bacterium]|jgi:DNA-binding transcriptional LysR family regulator